MPTVGELGHLKRAAEASSGVAGAAGPMAASVAATSRLGRFPASVDPDVAQAAETGFIDSFQPSSSGPSWAESLFRSAGPTGLSVYKQLPRLRLPDTLAGAGIGAAVGLLAQAARNTFSKKRKGYFGAGLLGAALGAGAGNLAGDRARRYLSNTLTPSGFGTGTAEGRPNVLTRIMPRNFQHFWDAAVLDRPSHAPVPGEYTYRELFGENKVSPAESQAAFRKALPTWPTLPPRIEMMRRELGVHTTDKLKDVWAENPDGSLSLNPANPDVHKYLPLLTGTGNHAERLAERPWSVFSDVSTGHGGSNSPADSVLMSGVTGGQRLRVMPLPNTPGARRSERPSMIATVKDRWDYTLEPDEKAHLLYGLGRLLRGDRAWLDSKAPQRFESSYVAPGTSNNDLMKGYGARALMDSLAVWRQPWVHQHLRLDPAGGAYKATPLTGEGRPYPPAPALEKDGADVAIERALAALKAPALTGKRSLLPELLQAKAESDRKNYTAKAQIMRRLLRAAPNDFVVDSEQGPILGLTHNSGFKIHLPRHALPVPIRRAGVPA